MGLYDVVNGVYRKVVKKYDPVDGVYRKVKAAYDQVDGVHRQYFLSGIPWMKFHFIRNEYVTETYVLNELVYVSDGTDFNKSFTGYHTYTFDRENGTVYASGELLTVDVNHPGGVYVDAEYYGSNSVHYCRINASGYWNISRRYVGVITETTVECTIGDSVGTVLAAEGEYPDANLGYTYVDVYDGYTIMQDPDAGDYYAYLLEEE